MPLRLVLCTACFALLALRVVRAEDDPVRPVLAGNRFVQPLTGEVLGSVPGASAYDDAVPLPGSPGRFRIGKLIVDAASRRVVDRVNEEISLEGDAVIRHDPAGEVIWSHALVEKPGGVRPPDRLAYENWVFVVAGNAVVALDRGTGAEKWRAEGEHDRLLASGPLLLATCCSSPPDPKHGRCLVARETQTGSEIFRARLPDESDPDAIREIGEMLVVTDAGFGKTHPAYARFFDRAGKLRFELPEHPAQFWAAGSDLVMVTPDRLARIDPQGKTMWETKELRSGDGAGFAALPGGDFLTYVWEPISDEGVDVMRVNAANGQIAWKVHCAGLGVSHSKYWQRCYVEVRGDVLVIVSQAAGGHFVEVLDAGKGVSVKRTLVGVEGH